MNAFPGHGISMLDTRTDRKATGFSHDIIVRSGGTRGAPSVRAAKNARKGESMPSAYAHN